MTGPTVHVDARPAALDLDLERTAVIVVDMQNHFAAHGGTFHNAGLDTDPVLETVPRIRRVLDAARETGVRVIFLRVNAPAEPIPGGQTGFRSSTPLPDLRWQRYTELAATRPPSTGALPEGASPTWNADFLAGLEPLPTETVITKPRYSGFYGTDLHERLQAEGIATLVLAGTTTSVCVESTLRDAYHRGYRCLLLEDCVAEPMGQLNHEATLRAAELLFGHVTASSELCDALAAAEAVATH